MAPADIGHKVKELDQQLNEWYRGLGSVYRARPTSKFIKMHPQKTVLHCLFFYFAYHGTLCRIHNVLATPWGRPALQHTREEDYGTGIEESAAIVAEASRSLARATQQLEINASSHVW